MMNRVVVAVVILVGVQAAVWWVRKGREPEEIRAPNQSFSGLPMRLGEWSGRDEPMDPRMGAAVGAVDVVNRQYVDELGAKIAVQVAAFATADNELPHDPHLCYGQVGWTVVDHKSLDLRVNANTTRPAQLLVFEHDQQRILVVFWYQFGDANVTSIDGLRRARWTHFGEKAWPPLLKVLIQINAPDAARAEATISRFAEHVLAWTKNVL